MGHTAQLARSLPEVGRPWNLISPLVIFQKVGVFDVQIFLITHVLASGELALWTTILVVLILLLLHAPIRMDIHVWFADIIVEVPGKAVAVLSLD